MLLKITAHQSSLVVPDAARCRSTLPTQCLGRCFGIPRDHMPIMRFDRHTGVAMGYGYTGEGVATARPLRQVLADLITERDTELTRLPMTYHEPFDLGTGTLRWLGYKIVRRGRLQGERGGRADGSMPREARDRPTSLELRAAEGLEIALAHGTLTLRSSMDRPARGRLHAWFAPQSRSVERSPT